MFMLHYALPCTKAKALHGSCHLLVSMGYYQCMQTGDAHRVSQCLTWTTWPFQEPSLHAFTRSANIVPSLLSNLLLTCLSEGPAHIACTPIVGTRRGDGGVQRAVGGLTQTDANFHLLRLPPEF